MAEDFGQAAYLSAAKRLKFRLGREPTHAEIEAEARVGASRLQSEYEKFLRSRT